MPAPQPSEKQLAQLNREIEQLEADVARLEAERGAVEKDVRQTARRSRYLTFVRALRSPKASFDLWPFVVLMAGPLLIGVALLILMNLVTGSYPLAFFAFLLGVVAGVGLFATLMFHPADMLLTGQIADAMVQSRLRHARVEEKSGRITETREQMERLVEERRRRMASGQVQRAALLQRDWKGMPASEWEDYVVEVCRTLGASVSRAKRIDDDGANLLVEFTSKRVAVKTLVVRDIIQGTSVQPVIADKAALHCDSCAVITTGRFTGAAQDYAARNGCTLVGREEFPDFALGKIEL